MQRPEESPHVHRIDTLTVRTATTKIPNTWRTFPIHGLMVKPKTRRGMATGNGASPGHTAGCVAGVGQEKDRLEIQEVHDLLSLAKVRETLWKNWSFPV